MASHRIGEPRFSFPKAPVCLSPPRGQSTKQSKNHPLGRDEWSPPIKKRYKGHTHTSCPQGPPRLAGRHPYAGGLLTEHSVPHAAAVTYSNSYPDSNGYCIDFYHSYISTLIGLGIGVGQCAFRTIRTSLFFLVYS